MVVAKYHRESVEAANILIFMTFIPKRAQDQIKVAIPFFCGCPDVQAQHLFFFLIQTGTTSLTLSYQVWEAVSQKDRPETGEFLRRGRELRIEAL